MVRWGAIGVSAIVLSLATIGAAAADSKRILIVHSFGRDFKPWRDYATTIRMELDRQSPWPLDIHEHSLVTARSSDENPEVPFVEYLRALYERRPPDLIVSVGAPAAAFVQRYRARLFSATPMVLTAVEQRRVQYSVLAENDAVVAVSINYFAAIENILRVLPETKTVAVVVGTSPIEKFWREEIGREVKPLEDRVSFIWYDNLSFEDILKHAAALPSGSAIFWELMIVDAAGSVHEGDQALTRLHAVANAPIFSYDDSFFGRELVGGPMLSVLEGSRETAAVAMRILRGEKAGDIERPPVQFTSPKFDWRELQRWGIRESRLPPGSQIYFRTSTAWQRHRGELLGVFSVFVLQGALISWLLYERRRRRHSEAAAHELSGALIYAQEEERSRLARELHDDITQRLALLAIDAGREEGNPSRVAGGNAMKAMREGLVRLSEDVHALSYRLHPSVLEDLGLVEALKSEFERFSRIHSVRLEVKLAEIPDNLPHDTGLCLFRIAQEALNNIARHAEASRAEVALRRVDGGLQLAVKDDGIGFDPVQHHGNTGLGLGSMRQRVFLLGGKVEIESAPGRGTTIRAWVPLKEERRERSTAKA